MPGFVLTILHKLFCFSLTTAPRGIYYSCATERDTKFKIIKNRGS